MKNLSIEQTIEAAIQAVKAGKYNAVFGLCERQFASAASVLVNDRFAEIFGQDCPAVAIRDISHCGTRHVVRLLPVRNFL